MMTRILLILAALLSLAGEAVAQPKAPPSLWPASPTLSADLYSVHAEAPRQSIMTISNGPMKPSRASASNSTLTTYVLIMPIEASAYAIRIGFGFPFNNTEDIVSVGIYPSDSYGGPIVNQATWAGDLTDTSAYPTANSVYASCTTTISSETVSCPGGTAGFPSATTMYVLGANIATTPTTATIADGTHVTLSANATASGTVTLQFANKAAECKEYFDNKGADVDTINVSGTARNIVIAPNPSSPGTTDQSFVLNGIGDFVPCTSVSQAAPLNTTQIFFIYVTVGPNTDYLNTATAAYSTWNQNAQGAALVRSRYIFEGEAWNANTDYADNPTGTGFKAWNINPIQIIQYVTNQPGWNVVQSGDSLSAAPPDDGFSSVVYRSCKLISTPQAPCEWSSFAQGSGTWADYGEAMRSNLNVMRASALVAQPFARAEVGGATLAEFETLLSKIEASVKQTNTRLGLYGELPFTTTCDALTPCQTGVTTFRQILNTVSKSCQPNTDGQTCPMIPVLDFVPYVSAQPFGGNTWDYPATSTTANGATVAGATSIPINGAGVSPAYANWQMRDITTPAAVVSGCIISTSSATAITVPNTCVVGSGVQASDVLEFAIPGFIMGNYGDTAEGFSADNTHPWYPAVLQLMNSTVVPGVAPGPTFVKQLLGLQQ